MKFQKILLNSIKIILTIAFLFPVTTFAHWISITPILPFPSEVVVSSTTIATYTVTNIAPEMSLIVTDQSQFPAGSGLSILSSSCGALMAPGQSCAISLQLQAPATPQKISSELKEWANPSADGLRYPIVITIVKKPPIQYTITPSAGLGGRITPTTPQVVSSGASQLFTAIPDSGYKINQWLLDGSLVQTGGQSYMLSNITADHTVGVTFTSTMILTAAGWDATGASPSLLAISTDGGNKWGIQTIIGIPHSILYGTSCTGSGSNDICVAAGQDFTHSNAPILAVGTNRGNSWGVVQTITDLPITGSFNETSCTGSGVSGICIAVGRDITNIDQPMPLLVVGTAGVDAWTWKTITNLFTQQGEIDGISCTGQGGSAICTAAGVIADTCTPLLVVSTDGANTWTAPTISSVPIKGYFNAAGCTGDGANAICIAGGESIGGTLGSLLVASTDGGNTWEVKTISNIPTPQGIFNGASCTGSGKNAICIAAGLAFVDSNAIPLLAVSTDGANTWIAPTISDLPIDGGYFNAASCTGEGANAICIAAGIDYDRGTLLVVSTDGGVTWTVKPSVSSSGVFLSASCAGSGVSAVCTAGGFWAGEGLGSAPLLVASTDGGNTWNLKTMPNLPTVGGFFGSGVSAKKYIKKFIHQDYAILNKQKSSRQNCI